jgi:hypothetical protein
MGTHAALLAGNGHYRRAARVQLAEADADHVGFVSRGAA